MPRVPNGGAAGGRNNYETPLEYFRPWNDRFGFTVDAAASAENALCLRYYTIEDDGLKQSYKDERVWCNPPYRPPGISLYHWVRKAFESSRDENALWVMLLPPSTDTDWYHDFVWDEELKRPRHRAEISTPHSRIKFRDPAHPEKVDPPTGNLFVTFHPWVYPKGHSR